MVSLHNISLQFGDLVLFSEISFLINAGEKVGLVGKNGAGKSTLLKIICGEQDAEKGSINIPSGLTMGYLPQQLEPVNNKTVFDETISAFGEVLSLENKIKSINEELTRRTDYESGDYNVLINRLGEANERYEVLGGRTIRESVEKVLAGLGFLQSDHDRDTSELSGGWRMRIEIAKILLKRPDLLLLDEPTNHLDIESIQWLEDFLKSYSGALLLISHDRAFLDNITTRTIEIVLGDIHDYKVPYSKYTILRKERREHQLAAYRNQLKKIEQTERFIERFRYKNTKAVQVQSRIKQLEKMEKIEIDQEDNAAIHFRFPPAPRSGSIVVEMEGVSKQYGDNRVLENIDFIIERGEKVAFVGRNGTGKTTLSRILTGELDHAGTLKFGHNVKTGYYAQNQDELMDDKKTVFQTIDEVATGDARTRVRDILGSFLFSGEDINKKVKVLSGGERSRLALAKLLLEPVNLLLLDEPTNHLDMQSKDILKNALRQYNGTMILVSHDRDFLDGLTEKIYEFRDRKIKENVGGIWDFLKKRRISSLKELEKKAEIKKETKKVKGSPNKMLYEEMKSLDRDIRKVTGLIKKAEKQIEILEKEMKDISELLANPDKIQDNPDFDTLYGKYSDIEDQLKKQLAYWEELNNNLEALEQKRDL